ncbi:MAG: hypothetical protein HYV93_14755 [Candidatus Rokubacteria bacterium]|nr:hypothetical protein [Candidatus Rokubacteria bacterium]
MARGDDVGRRRWAGQAALLALSALVVAGCATTGPDPRHGTEFLVPPDEQLTPAAAGLKGDLYRIGPLRVLIRPQPEVDFLCRLRSTMGLERRPTGRIHGCYLPGENVVVSTPDPYALLHELKHHFEGHWHD